MGQRVWAWAGAVVVGTLGGCATSVVKPAPEPRAAQPAMPLAPPPLVVTRIVPAETSDASANAGVAPSNGADPPISIYDHGSGKPTASFPDAPAAPRPTPSPLPASAGGSMANSGTAVVGGAPSPTKGNVSNAAQVVAAMRDGFRSCYQEGLVEDHDLEGSVRIVIHVGENGYVSDAQGTATGIPSSVVDCVLRRARSAKFDPPEGGSAVIAVPVTFVKQR